MIEELFKSGSTVIEILKVGVSGVAFLMATLGYLLLRKEQDRDAPRDQFLRAIKFFIGATILFGGIVGVTVLFGNTGGSSAREEISSHGMPYVVESSIYYVDLTHWTGLTGPESEKQSKVPILRVDRIRKVSKTDEPYHIPYYSRGLGIDFEPLFGPVMATFEKVDPPQDYKIAYEFEVAIESQPVGFEADLVNRFTFWNGFKNPTKEDWKANIKYPTKRVVVQIRFPNDKPCKNIRVYREESNMPRQIPEKHAPIRTPDGLVVVWSGEDLLPGQRVAFEFEW